MNNGLKESVLQSVDPIATEECAKYTQTTTQWDKPTRAGLKDVWNAFMLKGAQFAESDIPICPCTAKALPKSIISWPNAKTLHKKAAAQGDNNYHANSFVHFYVDDCKFDGLQSGIWQQPEKALDIMRHFDGIITPDYSTYQDFPEPLKVYNTYRMRAFGYWAGEEGIPVINNVRWGTSETWHYCFSGIPKRSAVCIGTVGGSPRRLRDRTRFNEGFREMIKRLEPSTIIVVGSANYPCFESAQRSGFKIVQFDSEAMRAFERRTLDE